MIIYSKFVLQMGTVFLSPGSVILAQEVADASPIRIVSSYEDTNKVVLHVNERLAEGCDMQLDLYKLAEQRKTDGQRSSRKKLTHTTDARFF